MSDLRFAIESNVPMPNDVGSFRKYPIADMDIGDSFAIPKDLAPKNPNSSIHHAAKKLGIVCTVRKMPNGDYRVWRTS